MVRLRAIVVAEVGPVNGWRAARGAATGAAWERRLDRDTGALERRIDALRAWASELTRSGSGRGRLAASSKIERPLGTEDFRSVAIGDHAAYAPCGRQVAAKPTSADS